MTFTTIFKHSLFGRGAFTFSEMSNTFELWIDIYDPCLHTRNVAALHILLVLLLLLLLLIR